MKYYYDFKEKHLRKETLNDYYNTGIIIVYILYFISIVIYPDTLHTHTVSAIHRRYSSQSTMQ